MRSSRLITICAATLLAGSAVSAVILGGPANAATPPAAPANRLLAANTSTSVSRGSIAAALSRAGTLAPRPRSDAAMPQRVVPHLDPSLNLTAGLSAVGTGTGKLAEHNGQVAVTVRGSGAAAAAVAAGGRVLGAAGGAVTVAIAPGKLSTLAGRPGVSRVSRPVTPLPEVTQSAQQSEGVVASGAQNWADNGLGNGGAGINIGIVDAGFGNLAAELSAGHLGNSAQVVYPSNQNRCLDDTVTDHGTAVAEVVHQMAPNATLYLYCVVDNVTFSAAASQIVNAGNIKIVNSSLGFTAESRGDGTGGPNTTEQAVQDARAAGVLWIQSAGNSAEDHWSGNMVNANPPGSGGKTDDYVDLVDKATNADVTALDPGTAGSIVLSWDQWPTSTLGVSLGVQEFDTAGNQVGSVVFADHLSGDQPTLEIDISNNDPVVRLYQVFIREDVSNPTVHYDLYYGGDVYPSYLSGVYPARAAAGSILQPASSPGALAVGAVDWRSNKLEPFSSQGPTIDGRVKPDLLGYDGTFSYLSGVVSNASEHSPIDPTLSGFYGTSSAAPHVAGAAALVLGANPSFTASDLASYLQARAYPKVNPPTNTSGYGLLQLLDPASLSCTASTVLPAKIVVDRADISFPLTVTTNCTHYLALAGLVSGSNVMDNLFWQDSAPTRTTHFYAQDDVVGTYTSKLNGGVADQGKVNWTPSSAMVIKYVTQDYVASSRKGSAVYINGLLKNYSNTAAGLVHPTGRLMYLQRYLNGGWQNMLSRPVNSAGAMAVGFIQNTVYQYRLITLESATAWNGASASTFR